jgi:hypothetical protein
VKFGLWPLVTLALAALACQAAARETEPVETAAPAAAHTRPPAGIPTTSEGSTQEAGVVEATASPTLSPTAAGGLPAGKPPPVSTGGDPAGRAACGAHRASALVRFRCSAGGALLGRSPIL